MHNAKKTERDPLVSPAIVCYAEKRKKTFGFSYLGQQVQFFRTLKFCRTFGRTILVTSGLSKKTLAKYHDYSRLFTLKKRRVKIEKDHKSFPVPERTAFYFEPFVLPYSSNSDPPDESALWIELRKLRTSSMKGKKVGKVNLSSVASQTNSARDRNDVLTYTTTTKPKEKDDDSDSESRKRPPTFVKVGQILILAIIFLVLFLAAIYMLIIACFKITRNINNQPKY